MRSRSCRISQLMSGSRLPVGSSAMIRRGSWTRARAIAVRCCSPPDSWVGVCCAWAVRPTSASTRSTAGRIWRRGVPVTSSANATFSQTVLVGSSLKSWKMIPILRRIFGTWRRGSRARSWPSSTTSPRVAISSRMSSLMSVDLPAPDGPTRNTKSPFGDDEVDVAQRDLAVRVLLRDVVQHEDRALRRRPDRGVDRGAVGGASAPAAALGRWSHVDSAGGSSGDRRVTGSERYDSVRGHGRGSHVGPEATTRPWHRQT